MIYLLMLLAGAVVMVLFSFYTEEENELTKRCKVLEVSLVDGYNDGSVDAFLIDEIYSKLATKVLMDSSNTMHRDLERLDYSKDRIYKAIF